MGKVEILETDSPEIIFTKLTTATKTVGVMTVPMLDSTDLFELGSYLKSHATLRNAEISNAIETVRKLKHEGLSNNDIAQKYGVSESTVRILAYESYE